MSRLLSSILGIIAGIVFIGIGKRADMWGWIAAYWAVLTVKNVYDAARRAKV